MAPLVGDDVAVPGRLGQLVALRRLHELALLANFAVLLLMQQGQPSHVAICTFALLWCMRFSAKMNLFFGVPEVGEQYLARHLAYLASYFRRGSISAFFFLSVGVACVLIVTKAIAWWLSGSVSMLAGLTDSLLDGVTSLLNLLAVHYALRPADDDHRYGHGKAESLAGMAQALFIAGSAVLIALQAYERLKDTYAEEHARR